MKTEKLWIASLPIIFLFSGLQLVADMGERGTLDSHFLRETIYPITLTLNGTLTNLKFKLRGEEPPKNKIVILAADDASLETFGRWPWARDIYAHLIYATFETGAKVMGLDVVFSEPQERVHPSVYTVLAASKASPTVVSQIKSLEPDPLLQEVIQKYQKQLVLGYTGSLCQPRYAKNADDCPVTLASDQEASTNALKTIQNKMPIDHSMPLQTSTLSFVNGIFNLPIFTDSAIHAGSFTAIPDPDGYIRRYPVVFAHQHNLYPSLALSMAMIGQSNLKPPQTSTGLMSLNFRGSTLKNNFTTISAAAFLDSFEKKTNEYNETFKDAFVFFGTTAMGVYDMRAFPFNSNSPGVEGHATALDNLLSHDFMKTAETMGLGWAPYIWLWVFGLCFAFLFSRLDAIPSLGLIAAFFVVTGGIDLYFFKQAVNWPTSILLIQTLVLFTLLQSARYIIEEKNRKFIRQAFSFYLAPQVVEYVLKDPTKLTVGGERRDLSILFTDLRGFTTLSETMDPKTLSQFLNEYLTAMTDIIFEYGGTLDKYIGDAVMAFWGAPIDDPKHAENAIKASLKMQSKMHEMAPYFKEKYKVDVAMGVGVNSGAVSVGNMGSEKIFEYTVIGDHVNLASRLEGLTKTYGVDLLCSRFTLDALSEELKNTLNYRILDCVKVKGKNQAVDLIELAPQPHDTKALELFYLAKKEFKDRNFLLAKEYFKQSTAAYQAATGQADAVCNIFFERCLQFIINPPPENWDGSFEMRTK